MNENKCFNGVFNGQGHMIKGLVLNASSSSSSHYVGLFGLSKGATIKNVVIDVSCSFTENAIFSKNYHIGSVIGSCDSRNSPCKIESIVNMGNVALSGSLGNYIWVGGIAGYLNGNSQKDVLMKNCANYGSVANNGVSGENAYEYFGGLVGYCGGSSSGSTCNIHNSINHGAVVNAGTVANSYIGGLAGTLSRFASVENCANTGKLEVGQESSVKIGSIAGYIDSSSSDRNRIEIKYCLSTSGYNVCGSYGGSTSGISIANLSTSVSLNGDAVNEFNERAKYGDGWNEWVFNPSSNTVSFAINGGDSFPFSSQIILLPDPAEDSEHTFSGWFNDTVFKSKFISRNITENTTLYGGWVWAVTFSFGNGTNATKNATCGYEIAFPEDPVREGYTFNGWEPRGVTRMLAHDITFTADWIVAPKGDSSSSSSSSTSFTTQPFSSSSIISSSTSLTQPFSSSSSSSSSSPSMFVEIVFGTKDLSEEDIKEIIEKYAEGNEYEMKIVAVDDDTTTVIVRFVDTETAQNFIEKINAGSEEGRKVIKNIKFTWSDMWSFSALVLPSSLFTCTIC